MNLLNLIEDTTAGYDNLRALMQASQSGQDAVLNIGGETITLDPMETRWIFAKYKAFNKAGRQEEFLNHLADPVKFDQHMKQLRQLIDKQKNFQGSIPGQRGVTGDVPQGQVNELSSDLLRKSAQVAKDKSDQAMDPTVHNALGGGYMNPLAKHYDTLSQKFNDRAVKVGRKNAVKNIASPATMRKIGMAEAEPVAVEEIAMTNPDRPTAQTAGKVNWERMIKDYMGNKPYTEFEFGTDRPLTLYRSQVYAILKDFGRMKPQQKVGIILNTFGDKTAMVDYIDKLRAKGMMPKKVPAYVAPGTEPVPPGQMSFPGMDSPKIRESEAQKKNSEITELDRKAIVNPRVARAFQLARARQSAAGSDIEAFVQDELEKSQAAQTEIDQLRKDNDSQDQQMQQLASVVQQQDQEIQQLKQQPKSVATKPAPEVPAKPAVKPEEPKADKPKEPKAAEKPAEPKAAEKPAEPDVATQPQQQPTDVAQPAPEKKKKPAVRRKAAPKKAKEPALDTTVIQSPPYVELPSDSNVIPIGRGRKKKPDTAVDPMAAAMQGVDIADFGKAVGMNEGSEELQVGDPVIIGGNVEHAGKTGDVSGFGRDKHFVIVDLYNFGKHAFHASNVEYNNYADEEDNVEEMQTHLDRYNVNQPTPGGSNKQREEFLNARDRLFRQMANASPGEKEAIRLKIAELEGRAQSQGIRIRETDDLNRSGYNAIKTVNDWAEKMRVMRELQKDIALMSDPEAKAAVQQRIGDLLKVGIKQGYIKEALNDKAMSVLRSLQQPAQPAPAAVDLNTPAGPRRGRPTNAQRAQRHEEFLTLRRRIALLDELIQMKEQIDRLFLKAQNVRGGIYPGLQADIEMEELYPVPETDRQFQDLRDKYTKDLAALQKFLAMKKAVYREGQDTVSESTALVRLKQARQALSQQGVAEAIVGKPKYSEPHQSGRGFYSAADYMVRTKHQLGSHVYTAVTQVDADNDRYYFIYQKGNKEPVFYATDMGQFEVRTDKLGNRISNAIMTAHREATDHDLEKYMLGDDESEWDQEKNMAEGSEPTEKVSAVIKRVLGDKLLWGRRISQLIKSPRANFDRYQMLHIRVYDDFGPDELNPEPFSANEGQPLAKKLKRELIKAGYPVSSDLLIYPEAIMFNVRKPTTTAEQGVDEAQTDYQKRRQRERDVDAGRPVKPLPKNPQTDYARMRAKQKRDQELGEKKDSSPGKITKSEDPCWTGYHMVGKKKKNGREVPNCVPGKKG